MAKQANRMMIGAFVVIAVTIMAASLVVLGSGKFFKKTNKYLLFFDESVKGLSNGAPVLFQGVQVGSVVSVEIQTNLTDLTTQIPVIIEIEPGKFHAGAEIQNASAEQRKHTAAKLIERGLRAQLGMQSFITGQLVVELDFFSNAAICYPPAQIDPEYKNYIVIPTCRSTSAKLANALEKLDLAMLEKKFDSILAGVDKLVNNPDLAGSIRTLKDTLEDARKLVKNVDRQVDPLSKDLKKTVKDINKLANNIDAQVGGLAGGLDKTLAKARGFLSEDSPLIVDLENTLKEISAMSRSLRHLSNYLEEHPEVLIRGKAKPKPGGK
jgi:paraquat-inducible protein B